MLPTCLNELIQRLEARAGPRRIHAACLGLRLAKLAEARSPRDATTVPAMTCSQRIGERALPFRSPHDSIDFVGPRVILDRAEQPVSVVRIVEAERVGVAAVEALLLRLCDAGHVRTPDVFEPADGLHA